MLTDEMLRQIMPNAPKARRAASLPILNATMAFYDINNERRAAAWLATLAAESGELKYQQELASGGAYEGRHDLGNVLPGDGKRFKGHGRIQITGRSNHAAYTQYLRGRAHLPFVDFLKEPQRLAEEPYATDSAGWFWAVLHDLNSPADKRNFLKTQTTVNGRNKNGLPNHWTERKAYYERALRVLPDDFLLAGAEAVEDDTPTDYDDHTVTETTDSEPKETSSEPAPVVPAEGGPKNAPVQPGPEAPAIAVTTVAPAKESAVKRLWTALGLGGIGLGTFAGKIGGFFQNIDTGLLRIVILLGLGALVIFLLGQFVNGLFDRWSAHQLNKLQAQSAQNRNTNTIQFVPPQAGAKE